jgi:hypothetical protein
MDETLLGYRTCLTEAQKAFERQSLSMDHAKEMSKTLFQVGSVIVAIIAALKVWGSGAQGIEAAAFTFLLIISVLAYVILIWLFMKTLSPTGWNGPINTQWDVLYNAFMNKDEIEVLRMQLSSYLNALDLNDKILYRFAKYVKVETWLLGVTVLLLLMVSLMPR